MRRNGGFSAFNRIGLTGNVSPFTKMSYGKRRSDAFSPCSLFNNAD